jgi:predicted extracellular nuclease
MSKTVFFALIFTLTAVSAASAAPIVITEWMYNPSVAGSGGEYFEITNIGSSPVSMTGWTEDDSTSDSIGGPGLHSLSAFGTLQPGESAVGTEGADAAAFKTYWNLGPSVKVIAYGTSNNLGRADTINIYDNTNARVDQLKYDDQTIGGFRTNGTSANIAFSQLGLNHANLAVASTVGDIYGSYRGNGGTGDLGNPGSYPVPEPATCVLLALGATLLVVRRQRQA